MSAWKPQCNERGVIKPFCQCLEIMSQRQESLCQPGLSGEGLVNPTALPGGRMRLKEEQWKLGKPQNKVENWLVDKTQASILGSDNTDHPKHMCGCPCVWANACTWRCRVDTQQRLIFLFINGDRLSWLSSDLCISTNLVTPLALGIHCCLFLTTGIS